MQIEPHVVEPGFIKRWTVQAIALLLRSPITWGFVIVLYFLTSKLFENPIWYFFLGYLLLLISLEFACFSDFNKMTVNGFFSCIRIAVKNYIQCLKSRKLFIVVFCMVMLVLEHTLSKNPQNIPDESMFTSMMFTVIFGYIFLNNGGRLQIFTYPIQRAFDSDEDVAISAVCLKATHKNPKVLFFFEIGIFLNMLFWGAFFPALGLFFSIFVPCLIYVAFREIFWGTKENQKQEESSYQSSSNMALVRIKD